MNKRLKPKEARFVQALVYTDRPHLVLLKTRGTSLIVAVAVNNERYNDPYFGVEISKDQFIEFIREKFDLLYLFKKPSFKTWYIFDLDDQVDELVPIYKLAPTPEMEREFYPGSGIFARELTEELDGEILKSQDTEKFLIDGKWDLPEISQFYGKYTDIYVILQSVDLYLDQNEELDRRRKVKDALLKPYQGGGSYGSAYDSLLSVQERGDRLHVDAIQYASPGYVNIKGREETFRKTRDLIEHFARQGSFLTKEYNDLHKFLSEMKLLKMPADKFEKDNDISKEVMSRAKNFSENLGAVSYDALNRISDGNQLIVAKVLLSIHRRLSKLYEFFLEGRVRF